MRKKKIKIQFKDEMNPRCEVCGTHNYTEEELLHLMTFDDYNPGEFEGYEACPDCAFEILHMGRNPITKNQLNGAHKSVRSLA